MPILEHDRTLLRSWTRTTAIRLAGPRYWSNLPPAKTSDNRTCHTAKATTRQPDILCVAGTSSRLEQSATGHSFRTYIIDFQKHAQDTSLLTFLLH